MILGIEETIDEGVPMIRLTTTMESNGLGISSYNFSKVVAAAVHVKKYARCISSSNTWKPDWVLSAFLSDLDS
jgi:hypothetical protein